MAKDNFYIRLGYEDGQEFYIVNGKEKSYNTNELVELLRSGIQKRTIKFGKKIEEEATTRYIFDVDAFSDKKNDFYKAKFSIKVLNKDKEKIKAVSKLAALTNAQIKVKNKNKTRLVAGILIGATILTMSSPVIIKGLNKLLKRESEYDNAIITQHLDMIEREKQMTIGDQIIAQHNYYQDLAERAKEGDKEAQEELTQYLYEQQRLEEIKEEERSNGYIR